MTMKQISTILLTLALLPTVARAQDATEIRRLFEGGKNQQAVQALTAEAAPSAIFNAALAQEKLGDKDKAKEIYQRLVELPETDAWHFVGASGQQLLDSDITNERDARRAQDAALQLATKATEVSADLAEAQFQLGLVMARREDWNAAATAFDKASTLNPAYAYAHYYGGMSHYHAGRPDRMAIHFEAFLKLAPDAPERPEVTQIMRTVRGR